MQNPLSLHIEDEFLYWTNGAGFASDHGGSIHKAFTEPFIKPVPFQTYEFLNTTFVRDIASNKHLIFFTGQIGSLDSAPNNQVDVSGADNLYFQIKQTRVFDEVQKS